MTGFTTVSHINLQTTFQAFEPDSLHTVGSKPCDADSFPTADPAAKWTVYGLGEVR